MRRRDDGSLAFTPPYTLEEQVQIDRHRRNLRLKIAREAFEQARDRYFELRALDQERVREEEAVN
jgi:hypothetical protein